MEYLDAHAEELATGKTGKVDQSRQNEALRKRAISDHRKLDDIQNSCNFCFSNPNIPKHLIVSVGTKTYLALPEKGSLTKGHCLIVPTEHLPSASSVDEDIWQEIRVSVVRMVSLPLF